MNERKPFVVMTEDANTAFAIDAEMQNERIAQSPIPSDQIFPLNVVLSVTTGRLLCEVTDLYRIMGHITGDPYITTIGLVACADVARESIYSQYPELGITMDRSDELSNLVSVHGGETGCFIWVESLMKEEKLKSSYSIKCVRA